MVSAEAKVPGASPSAETATGSATAAKGPGRRGLWIGMAVAVLIAVAVGLTQFLRGARDAVEAPVIVSPVPDVEPEVETPVIVVPRPEIEPEEDLQVPVHVIDQGQLPSPVRPVAPGDDVDAAIVGLEQGDVQRVVPGLYELLASDSMALSAQSLGPRHDALAGALVVAAEQAFVMGDYTTGMEAFGLLNQMAPFDPEMEALIFGRLAPFLETGAPTSAGPDEGLAAKPEQLPMMYTVSQGDTLWGIARRLTGDPENWPELWERNNAAYKAGIGETYIADPGLIFPGQRIYAPISGGAGGSVIEYHVSRGESLWRIAERIYGDPLLWNQIYADNRATIADPDLIYPGQVLLLRPRSDR